MSTEGALNVNSANQFFQLIKFLGTFKNGNHHLPLDITADKYFTCRSMDAIRSWRSRSATSASFNGFSFSFECNKQNLSNILAN